MCQQRDDVEKVLADGRIFSLLYLFLQRITIEQDLENSCVMNV